MIDYDSYSDSGGNSGSRWWKTVVEGFELNSNNCGGVVVVLSSGVVVTTGKLGTLL